MKLMNENLKKDGKMVVQVNDITKESLISAFRVTQDHMLEASKILETEENTKNLEISSA